MGGGGREEWAEGYHCSPPTVFLHTLSPTICFHHHTHSRHWHPHHRYTPGLCCVSKKKKKKKSVLLQQSPGTCSPHIKAASFSLNVNIKSVDHKSQHSLHKLPLPQPLILPSDEGERGRGVSARGSDGGREGRRERWWEERWRWKAREPTKQLLASWIWHLPNAPCFRKKKKNAWLQHPIKFGRGPA